VPDQIGIIGFNDIAMAAWPAYRLTTIRQPIGDIINTAVGMIAAMVEPGAPLAKSKLFGCSLVERRTLKPR
jgi:DNA-binding LacI/PurR family transcriptional regulator